jgi:hypothetical protein
MKESTYTIVVMRDGKPTVQMIKGFGLRDARRAYGIDAKDVIAAFDGYNPTLDLSTGISQKPQKPNIHNPTICVEIRPDVTINASGLQVDFHRGTVEQRQRGNLILRLSLSELKGVVKLLEGLSMVSG